MKTSPLLARRAIPRKERVQKALGVLTVTAVVVAAAWLLTDASPDSDPRHLVAIAAAAMVGLCLSAYFWFRREESARTKEESRSVRDRIDDDRQGRGWVSRLGYNTRRLLAGIVVIAGLLIVLAGLGVLGLQLFDYLKTGRWNSVSTLSVVIPHVSWLSDPQSWFGLHDILRSFLGLLPFSVCLVLVGGLVAGFGSSLRQRVSR